MTNGRQPLSSRPRGTARGGVTDDELRAAWARWLGALRNRGCDPAPVLRPGAAPSTLAVAEQAVGALPEPVRALYALNDGQEDAAGPLVFPAHAFCSLDRGTRAARGDDPGLWPLAEDAVGHHLLVERETGRVVVASGSGYRELAPDLVAYLGLLADTELDLPDAGSWDAPGLR
ncbi:hypothetical protein WCD74_29075 [Actinomycetospora sp. OC33-EN08]|uniref:SMI1/KNR4 family protein n=1 Tax=Actinomycetospora aurantiaca TaxID=3129233 RepID=A0ABU8MY36_9PSEU